MSILIDDLEILQVLVHCLEYGSFLQVAIYTVNNKGEVNQCHGVCSFLRGCPYVRQLLYIKNYFYIRVQGSSCKQASQIPCT